MRCGGCGFDNPSGMKFCGNCGAHLQTPCPLCGTLIAAATAACPSCGAATPARGRSPERRQITVMFCDLVGSSSMSERMDPEELGELLESYRDVCAKAVREWGGVIARYLGDGLLVYFGYPTAHEDDPRRAVEAGLDIVSAIERPAGELQPDDRRTMQVRIGIHTGVVVAGDLGSGDAREHMAVVGDTPNIAARLQALARPGVVVISQVTKRLVEGHFACRSRGRKTLKGFTTPIEVFEARRPSRPRRRSTVAGPRDTSFLGRRDELRVLLDGWDRAARGEGQVIVLSGEAGIGKSRLVKVFRHSLRKQEHRWLDCHCSAFASDSELYPIVELFREEFGIGGLSRNGGGFARIDAALSRYGTPLSEQAPLFASLLSLDIPEGRRPVGLEARRLREATLQAAADWFGAASEPHPLVLVVEDLHWSDTSTRDFLELLVPMVRRSRILAIFTSRPEGPAAWLSAAPITKLHLDPLDRRHAQRMLLAMTGGKALPASLIAALLDKTDGVPLFIEELMKAILESEMLRDRGDRFELADEGHQLAIPATLRDSLMARFDRLGGAKQVGQVAAVLGRTFSYRLIRSVAGLPDSVLRDGLAVLVMSELVFQRGVPPDASYEFKHALIQDVAYQSLLKRERRQYHCQAALALSAEFPELVALRPELLAQHQSAGGLAEAAVRSWIEAGRIAARRSANVEAVAHLRNALREIRAARDPAWEQRDQDELTVQIALGARLTAISGWAAKEVEEAYLRAQALCERAGERRELFNVVRGLFSVYLLRGDLAAASGLGERLMEMAAVDGEDVMRLEAPRALGICRFLAGRFAEARAYLDESIANYDPFRHHGQTYVYGLQPAVLSRCWKSWTLWFLGAAGEAQAVSDAAIALAREVSHPFSLCYALSFSASLQQCRRRPGAALASAEAAITLAGEEGYPYWLAWGKMLRGWALACGSGSRDGLAVLREGLADYAGTGARQIRGYGLTLLAEACHCLGDTPGGLAAVAEAAALEAETGIAFFAAETLRIRSRLWAASDPVLARATLRQAIDLAVRQGACYPRLRGCRDLLQIDRGTDSCAADLQCLRQAYQAIKDAPGERDLDEARDLIGRDQAWC